MAPGVRVGGEDRQIYGTCRMENKTARAEERQQDGRGGRRRLQDSDAGLLRDGVGGILKMDVKWHLLFDEV